MLPPSSNISQPNQQEVQLPIAQGHPRERESLCLLSLWKNLGKDSNLSGKKNVFFLWPITTYRGMLLLLVKSGSCALQLLEMRLGYHDVYSHQDDTRLGKILQGKGMLLSEGNWLVNMLDKGGEKTQNYWCTAWPFDLCSDFIFC